MTRRSIFKAVGNMDADTGVSIFKADENRTAGARRCIFEAEIHHLLRHQISRKHKIEMKKIKAFTFSQMSLLLDKNLSQNISTTCSL